jgi:hypothetical protein
VGLPARARTAGFRSGQTTAKLKRATNPWSRYVTFICAFSNTGIDELKAPMPTRSLPIDRFRLPCPSTERHPEITNTGILETFHWLHALQASWRPDSRKTNLAAALAVSTLTATGRLYCLSRLQARSWLLHDTSKILGTSSSSRRGSTGATQALPQTSALVFLREVH